jgi:hypothetical protein
MLKAKQESIAVMKFRKEIGMKCLFIQLEEKEFQFLCLGKGMVMT